MITIVNRSDFPLGSAGEFSSPLLETLSIHLPPERIDRVLRVTRKSGVRRQRRLPLRGIVWLVVSICLHADLDQLGAWRAVYGTRASLALAGLGGRPPAKSALSQAREKIGARPLRRLFVETAAIHVPPSSVGDYHGMRVLAIDGQRLAVVDTPENARAFGKPSTRRDGRHVDGGYPQVCTMRLVDTYSRMTLEAFVKPCRHAEYPCAAPLLRRTNKGDLVLLDSAFYGYSVVREVIDTGRHLLGRVSAHPVFERTQTLADGSFLTRIRPKDGRGSRHPSNALTLRVIQYTLDDKNRPGHGEKHRLVTTLLDAEKHPALELIELYHQRWEIEIANDEIKTHLLGRAVPLRSRTPRGVVQEFYGLMLAHNAVRSIMEEAAAGAAGAGGAGVEGRELSFINSVRMIREAIPLMRAAPTAQLPGIYRDLLKSIAQQKLPPRDGRINPRVVKIKMSKFKKKRPWHRKPPHPEKAFRRAVVVLS